MAWGLLLVVAVFTIWSEKFQTDEPWKEKFGNWWWILVPTYLLRFHWILCNSDQTVTNIKMPFWSPSFVRLWSELYAFAWWLKWLYMAPIFQRIPFRFPQKFYQRFCVTTNDCSFWFKQKFKLFSASAGENLLFVWQFIRGQRLTWPTNPNQSRDPGGNLTWPRLNKQVLVLHLFIKQTTQSPPDYQSSHLLNFSQIPDAGTLTDKWNPNQR